MRGHVNLLPFGYRRAQLLRLRLKQWLAIWTLAAAVLGALGWLQFDKYRSSGERLASLDQQCEPVQQLQQEVAGLRERIASLRTREALSLKLADERSLLSLFGLLSKSVRDGGARVTIRRLELRRQASTAPGEALNVLVLDGYGVDSMAIASFAAALRDQQAFTNVELRSAEKILVGNVEAQRYSMECAF